jgi:FkbM family methyltransferase
MSDLVYDVGMNDGDDTAFYLAKGFRVVAVEADPDLCKAAEQRFAQFVDDGRLTIVNRAIVPEPGPATFYRSDVGSWSTVVEEWDRGNRSLGHTSETLIVEGTTLAQVIDTFGEPYFVKLDIEGMDRLAVETLAATTIRPPYLSMEMSFARWAKFASVELDFQTLTQLGYDRFKIVDQDVVEQQVLPSPAQAGQYVDYKFTSGQSGPFGEESPGEWLTAEAALASFRQTCRKNWLPLLMYRNRRIFLYYSKIVHRLYGRCANFDWYDIHAKHCSVD